MKKRIIYTALTLLWMLLIFLMSAQTAEVSGTESSAISEKILSFLIENPSQNLIDTVETIIRKLCHFFEYALLCALLYRTLFCYEITGKMLALSILIAVLYAISDEIHQFFVPGRACRFYDVLIDTLGALLGYVTIKKLNGKNSK